LIKVQSGGSYFDTEGNPITVGESLHPLYKFKSFYGGGYRLYTVNGINMLESKWDLQREVSL